jgi:hypothetical protein
MHLSLIICGLAAVLILAACSKKKEVWQTTPGGPYSVVITEEELSCEHPKRPKESIRWKDVTEIQLVTTEDGPMNPDRWFIFIGDKGGCSIPDEAQGFDKLWDEIKRRFPGFDHSAYLRAENVKATVTFWKKSRTMPSSESSETLDR